MPRRSGDGFADSASVQAGDFDGAIEINRAIDEIEPTDVPDDLDFPGSGDTYKHCRQAIGRLYVYLQREGSAIHADFLKLVNLDKVDYAIGASSWSTYVKGRDHLRSLEGIQPPAEGEHTWHYLEEDRPSATPT